MEWLTVNLFPNFIQNISILATIAGTIITFLVLRRTKELYLLYNTKASDFYIVERISELHKEYSNRIKDIKEDSFQNDISSKQFFWEKIKEANGKVVSFESNKSPLYKHIRDFINNTSMLINIQNDLLTYQNVWDYYNHLTLLYQVLKSIQDMKVRHISN